MMSFAPGSQRRGRPATGKTGHSPGPRPSDHAHQPRNQPANGECTQDRAIWRDPRMRPLIFTHPSSRDISCSVGSRPFGVSSLTIPGRCWLSAARTSSRDRPASSHQRLDLIGIKNLFQIAGCDGLVWSVADPGIDGAALTGLLELLEQIAKAAAQYASCGAAGEQAAQTAAEEAAETATAIRGLACRRRTWRKRRNSTPVWPGSSSRRR